MKKDLYQYKDGDVSLEFSFPQGQSNIEEKKKFIRLLQEAIKELTQEIEIV